MIKIPNQVDGCYRDLTLVEAFKVVVGRVERLTELQTL
jgi:hypothetical protein